MRRGARGFTLIEVLIALLILSGGITMIALAWSGNFMKSRKATVYYDVSTLLERKMAEIEAKYRDKFTEVPEEENGEFEDVKTYRWRMKSRDMKFPDLAPLLAAGPDGGVDETLLSMVRQMTEYLNKVIKEVKVTIFVKKTRGAKKEQEFSATQYFVDYTQDFAAAAAGGAAAPGGAGGGGGASSSTPTPGSGR